jgi:hypothetical protein
MEPAPQPPDSPPPTLDYAKPGGGEMVLLARFASPEEAELHSAELAAEGIPTQIFNANVNTLGAFAVGLSDVGVYVHADDASRAAEVLKGSRGDDLEPAPEGGLAEPAIDEAGNAVKVVPLPPFDSVRRMRDAQTVLASANLPAYPPKLIPRGNRPPGIGKRFILSVAAEDLERAQFLLEQDEEESAEDLPRCPQCGSWRVYPVMHFLQSLAAAIGLSQKPAHQLECLTCHHRGPSAEFKRSA